MDRLAVSPCGNPEMTLDEALAAYTRSDVVVSGGKPIPANG